LSDYKNTSWRFVDAGLNLRDSPDLVRESKWIRLANVGTPQEGEISQRAGTDQFAFTDPTTPVNAIRRLDDNTLVIGHGARISTQVATLVPSGMSGSPLSIVPFKPIGASETWAYIGDTARMLKVHADGSVFQWGIDAPTTGTTLVIDGAGELDTTVADASVYDWIVTYASTRTGAEGNGSPPSTFSASGSAFAVLVSAAPSTDPQVDEVRFYRRGGTLFDDYRLSGTAVNNPALATITYRDARADSEILFSTTLPRTKFRPFPSVDSNGVTSYGTQVPYIAGPAFGRYIFAVGDSLRPGYVYWTNSEDPDTADVFNNVQVTSPAEPLVAVKLYNGIPFVFSRDNCYAMDPGLQSDQFQGRKTSLGRGTVGPFAVAVGPQMFVCSNDGIYRTTGDDQGVSITEDSLRPLFHGFVVEDYVPIDFANPVFIRLFYAGQDLHFLYRDINGGRQHLVWSSIYERWQASVEGSIVHTTVYGDENSAEGTVFFGGLDGGVYERNTNAASDAGASILVHARTGFNDMGIPQTLKEYGNIIVDCKPDGVPITITPFYNNIYQAQAPLIIVGTDRAKFTFPLPDVYAYSIALDIDWTTQFGKRPEIYQFDVLWREDEEKLKHWEFPSTSHGMSGWLSIRDLYLGMRLTVDATLTIQVDDINYSYIIPHTSGFRRKIYVPLRPTKGKMFRYVIDCPEIFSLYGEDCEVRVKSWNTNLGYQLVSPFTKA
jgi:hypothetical protein